MYTALVLAGRRDGVDAFADSQGVRHRALIEVDHVPMLERVVASLRDSAIIGRILVSIDDEGALREVPSLTALLDSGEIEIHSPLSSPSRSVEDALSARTAGEKVLVTTADHALLTPEMVEHFARASDASQADVSVGLVSAALLRAELPATQRTTLPMRGDAYSGANLFGFRTPEARRAASFWVRAERFRKQPWRLVSVFGPVALALFALRRLDIEAAFARASRAIGVRAKPVLMPFAEAAVDVDKPADLELANQLLAQRTRSLSATKRPLTGS